MHDSDTRLSIIYKLIDNFDLPNYDYIQHIIDRFYKTCKNLS